MTDINCQYAGDREATLIAYLYDDIDSGERAAFEHHLAGCARCRTELSSLGRVRQQLSRWNPPIPASISNQQLTITSRSEPRWRAIPVWAQVAAALLFLGVSAGVANLNVHYDASGLTIRTGWMTADAARLTQGSTAAAAMPVTAPAVANRTAAGDNRAASEPAFASKSDLAALEQRLRDQLRATPGAATVRTGASDADVLRRVRTLLDDSEKRQQRELALRLAQALNDVAAQRQADLRKIDTTLSGVQRDLGIEVLQQRERVNYLMRVNQRQ